MVGVMFRGEIVQYDTPELLFSRPRTPEVAEFLGATNFLHGTIRDAGGVTFIDTSIGPLKLGQSQPVRHGIPATATIRPEHIAICAPDRAETDNLVSGAITRRVFFGGSLAYDIQVGTTEIRVKEMSARSWREGDAVALCLPPEHLWIFDGTDDGRTP